MKKLILLLLLYSVSAQNAYEGEVIFDYYGTENGSFTSVIQDSIISGFSFSNNVNDSSLFVIASITEQEDNQYDLFLVTLQDTIYPLQPRIWTIEGDQNEEDPLNFETLLIFMPGLDSSFVLEFFEAFTDTNNQDDTTDLLLNLFTTLSSDLYLGVQGEIEISNVTDTSITGIFNALLIKPAFYFPPHTITIENGEFNFFEPAAPFLEIDNDIFIPQSISINNVFPNPFNAKTSIDITINAKSQYITLEIFDMLGRQQVTIFSGNIIPGNHSFFWKAEQYSSGIYFLALSTNTTIISKKLLLVK